MKFTEAKEKVEQILKEQKEAFDIEDITVTTSITYQDGDGEDCAEDDKGLRFLSAELNLLHKDLTENEVIGFCMLVDCKKRDKIDENQVNEEIEGFITELSKLKEEISLSQNVPEFMRALATEAEAQCRAMTAELSAAMAKIDRNVKILEISTIAVGVIALIAVLLINFFK